MLVNFSQTLTLAATQQDAWNLLRDMKRLAALIPGVESMLPVDQEKYAATVVERVGPFRLSLTLEVRIVQAIEPSLLKAELSGTDSYGQNRLSGTLNSARSEEHTSELQSRLHLVCRLLLDKKKILSARPSAGCRHRSA